MSATTYVRNQAMAAALANAVLNPLIEWARNPTKGFQPFLGTGSVAVNMALTSVILSVLVALFAARGVRHELAAGTVTDAATVRRSPLLQWFPRGPAWLGLAPGALAAAIVTAVLWVLDAFGVSGISFAGLLVGKTIYCAGLAFVVARWVIRRQLLSAATAPESSR